MKEPKSEFIFYQTEDKQTQIQVRLEGETVWLTQAQMAELFQSSVPNVSMHIRNVFSEKELQPEGTVKKYLIVQTEGGRTEGRTKGTEATQAFLVRLQRS